MSWLEKGEYGYVPTPLMPSELEQRIKKDAEVRKPLSGDGVTMPYRTYGTPPYKK